MASNSKKIAAKVVSHATEKIAASNAKAKGSKVVAAEVVKAPRASVATFDLKEFLSHKANVAIIHQLHEYTLEGNKKETSDKRRAELSTAWKELRRKSGMPVAMWPEAYRACGFARKAKVEKKAKVVAAEVVTNPRAKKANGKTAHMARAAAATA